MWWSEPAPAIRRRSQSWCTRSATRYWASHGGSSGIPTLAEDVLQNTLLTIWRKLPHLRDPDRFEGWAFRILVHACYADAPRNRRWASAIRVLHADVASNVDDIQMISDREELEQAFRRLPLDQRAVFVLHHHVGLPLVAVAETLGIPDGTARSRLHYATRALCATF
jgi:RNA polymerase sigma-70 factor, ECF subfamily